MCLYSVIYTAFIHHKHISNKKITSMQKIHIHAHTQSYIKHSRMSVC